MKIGESLRLKSCQISAIDLVLQARVDGKEGNKNWYSGNTKIAGKSHRFIENEWNHLSGLLNSRR